MLTIFTVMLKFLRPGLREATFVRHSDASFTLDTSHKIDGKDAY